MITPREDFGDDYINEMIAEWGDEPRLCVVYEEHYYGPDDPDNHWETNLHFYDDYRADLPVWGHASLWLIPGSTEEVMADCEEW